MRMLSRIVVCLVICGAGTTPVAGGKPKVSLTTKIQNSILNPYKAYAPFDDHMKTTIPAHRRVPPGWVVVGRRHSGIYSGRTCEMLVIEKLSNQIGIMMNISANQPIPDGWAVVTTYYSIHNPGFGANTIRIRKVY